MFESTDVDVIINVFLSKTLRQLEWKIIPSSKLLRISIKLLSSAMFFSLSLLIGRYLPLKQNIT